MPRYNKKSEGKGKGKKVDAATTGNDDAFDDMLAEVRAGDVIAEIATTISCSNRSSNINSTSTSSSSTEKLASSGRADEVSEEMLIRACVSGDISQLRRWAKRGFRVSSGRPLCHVVGHGMIDKARFLVNELEADANGIDEQGFTPLGIAAQMGNLEMSKFLVKELGADVHRQSKDGFSPLYVAAQAGNLQTVRCLVKEFGAEVNGLTKDGSTPLYAAAERGDMVIVRYLVEELGADVNQAVKSGSTPLMVAAELLHLDIVRYLLKHGADAQATRKEGTAADDSRYANAPAEETAYLMARTHCANPSCTNSGLKKCERCLKVYFCGNSCIRAHWPAHKAECTATAAKLKASLAKSSSSTSFSS
jgi:hypothetical protein